MRKVVIVLYLFLLVSFSSKADYSYSSLSYLICNADYAAVGTIVSIDKSYFYLKVEDYVLNSLEYDTLKIQKFESWDCGKRYDNYVIGQRELVFFKKSNYVISDYELLGYGGGGEFELPILKDSIYYNCSYSRLQAYEFKNFIVALKDLGQLKLRIDGKSNVVSIGELQSFAAKSPLHKLFIEYKSSPKRKYFDIPSEGYFINRKRNYLYQDYENKILLDSIDNDTAYILFENADVWKEEQYFVVKPKNGATTRWLRVYDLKDTFKKRELFRQLMSIVKLPEPRLYFGSFYRDTIHISDHESLIPRAAYFLDNLHEDQNLKYGLLRYTLEINSNGKSKSYKVKSEYPNYEIRERLNKLQANNSITIKDILVLFPNNSVRKIRGRTFWLAK